jgi:cysteinyl-tRNA synthetase, unknown class
MPTVDTMLRHHFGGLIALAIATAFAVAWPYRGNWAQSAANATMVRPLAQAKTWRYQLDRIDVAELAADPSDLLVIDYAKAEGKQPLTAKDVARIKVRPDGRHRLVVAYLSVGESEEYRYYWNAAWAQSPPDWLGEENCAWPKAHRVRYWTNGWKTINYRAEDSYLRRIIAAGFDGVYLDRVDIFETFEKERPQARKEMVAHVAELAAAARRVKPGFLVIPQNAETLLDDAYYRMVIDGLGKESLLHGGSETGKRNPDADIKWSAGLLRHLQNDGKPVFVVEYLLNAPQIDRAAAELRHRRIVPTFETRALDGQDPTTPVDLKVEVGTPERTTKQCPPGTSW